MQIAVVGCGWLGLPLALSLQKGGHKIVATSRSAAGCLRLDSHGFSTVQFELGAALSLQKFAPIFNCKLLILNIPFSKKNSSYSEFFSGIQEFLQQAKRLHIKQVIFISTTSVYGEQQGIVTENSPVQPNTLSGKVNLAVEKWLQQNFGSQSSIIRLAGLIGGKRHPINFLAGKTELAAPNKAVNLIHQVDVIQSIESIIHKDLWGHRLVLCAKEHPSRQDYYTWAAKRLGLTAPEFIQEQVKSTSKLIDASASIKKLGIQLKYPSPYDML
ncbi:NAD-dependent epimerase/dehydratase family protein [uncultured Paraglaciecola sp.]|uniref:NAD-dependent epimerase/dehydratase family protein n=1 Tax=uncultured Paraglaciecola sp. TaxID=1765024 RepID=UPI0026260B8E|nr:NAD-dependent epimerase/dehydratase family protein [uncultured Paraglaciecola sp.]